MISIAFLIVLVISVQAVNKKNGAGVSNDTLSFDRNSSLIILACFVSSLLMNYITMKFLKDYFIVVTLACAGVYTMILTIVNIWREESIKKKHDQIFNIYQALADIFGRVTLEDVDYENTPFQYDIDPKTKNVNKIVIDTSSPDGKINDNTITLAQYSINKFFPECQWTSENDHPNRTLTFKGLPKPPDIAKWMGSDYRPTGWIPLGLSGQGEVGWNISNPKSAQMGSSSYIDADGHIPNFVDMPSAPQTLVLGSPLSLDTIIPTTKGYKTMESIQVGDEVFDIYNKPVKVLGLSPIKMANQMFKIIVSNNKNEEITIKSDEIHKFPIIYENGFRDIKPISWIKNNYKTNNFYFVGINNEKYNILKIIEIENELVRCILVDSNSHLFFITDKIENEWHGGKEYKFKAVGTSNTGGGKAVWLGQLVQIKE